MTVVLISGGLTFVVGMLILGPFSITGRLRERARGRDEIRLRELLRQLRDLDDDLAAGKLTQEDHDRFRGVVELEAAALMERTSQPQPDRPAHGQEGEAGAGPGTAPTTPVPARSRSSGPPASRWRRWTAATLVVAGAAAGVTVLLLNSVSARHPGQDITGNPVAAPAPLAGNAGTAPAGSAPAAPAAGGPATPSPSGRQPTRQQVAAIAAAEAQVKQDPKDVSAHLALAEAFAAAGAGQQAAVEYLAVTQLDPTNAEANTSLALLAFEVGRAAQAKTMVNRVLTADPKYPEALYVRGLVDLMGLRQPTAAEHDFTSYLSVAPFGSHRAQAATLLALAQSQEHR
jgi:tetratricopeptide repeat protein